MIKRINYTIDKALAILTPDAKFILRDDVLEWMDEDVTQPTEAEIQAKLTELEAGEDLRVLRATRDEMLGETDWWVMPDRTPTQEQLDYRQALRDITETYSSLDDVVWPVKP